MVAMAIVEILAGKRFAFGVYVPEVRSGTGTANLRLAGSIILKSESYSRVMQAEESLHSRSIQTPPLWHPLI